MAVDVVVIGGGISGLAAAYFLGQAGARVTVLEKSPQVGGDLRVSDVAGVPVDEGAESLLNRRPEAVRLARAVGLGEDIVYPAQVSAGIWSRGAVHPMPPGTVMGVPSDPEALRGLLTADEVARVRAEQDLAGMPVTEDVAVGRLVAERMGRAVTDRLVEPLLAGVYAGHADQLSLRATVPALADAAAQKHSLLDAAAALTGARPNGGEPVFAGIRGGVGRLAGAVAAASGAEVRTGVTVRAIRRRGSGFEVETGPVPRPELIRTDGVVVAVPPVAASRLLADVAPDAAAQLRGIEQASVGIVTLALPAAAFAVPPDSSGFLVPPVERRTVKAVTFSSVKWPWLDQLAGDLVILRASVGRQGETADLQRADEELVGVVLDDLRELAGVKGAPVDSRVTRWGGALPQFAVGHAERMAAADAAVSAVPGLGICGAAFDGVGVAACIARADRTAAGVLADLGSDV
ncbi:MAG TPA: protoporphyrinogen oxidase [Jiangellaceae bacterium]